MDDLKKSSRLGKGLLILTTLAAVILILFSLGWFSRLKNWRAIERLASEDPLPRVELYVATSNPNPIELLLPTSAAAWHVTPIWARTNGYLINYYVDIGDHVKEGDLLASIDTPEVDQELAQATAELENSRAVFGIAKITSERWQGLWDRNREAVTKQEVDQYSANLKASEATVTANEKNVARLTYLQQFKYVLAPFEGIITQRNIDIGSLIYGNVNNTPQELFQIAQTHTVRFFVQVPQNYFRLIQDGVQAEVTVQEIPEKTFKGEVARYAKALNPSARTLYTEVDVENIDGVLYPGLFGVAKFLLIPDTTNFIIPTTAIIIRSGFPHVAVVDKDNVVHMAQVKIGRDYGKYIEVSDGLKEGDRIVVIPSDAIVEDAKVDIIGLREKIKVFDSANGLISAE